MKATIAKKTTGKSKVQNKVKKTVLQDHVPAYLPTSQMKTIPVPVPEHSTFTLPNGIKVLLIPRKRLPLIQISLLIKAGALHDPEGLAGCAELTTALLDAGCVMNGKRLSKIEIAEKVDKIGGSLSVNVDHSRIVVAASGLSQYTDELLDLLTAITRYPTFPAEEVERERQQHLASIIAKGDQPAWLADDALHKRIYLNHPMGKPGDGTAETVSRITRENIISLWNYLAQPNSVTIGITGDFDVKAMKATLSEHFDDWKTNQTHNSISEPEPLSEQVEIILVNKPGAVQSTIEMGHHGISRKHPDFYALLALEQILYSGMSSRFYKVIRAERGLTYSIHGGFEMGKMARPMIIATSTMKERTGYMVGSIFEVIEKFLESGPTPKELLDAQMYLTGSYPLRFETGGAIMTALLQLDWLDLPATAISDYRKNIAILTKNDVLKAARKHIQLGKMRVAIVGEVSDIEPQLKQIGRKYMVTKM